MAINLPPDIEVKEQLQTILAPDKKSGIPQERQITTGSVVRVGGKIVSAAKRAMLGLEPDRKMSDFDPDLLDEDRPRKLSSNPYTWGGDTSSYSRVSKVG